MLAVSGHQAVPGALSQMFAKSKTSALVLLCVAALLASACGGGTSSASDSTDVVPSTSSETTTEEDSSQGSSSGPSESPIGDLLGIPFTDSDAMDEYFSDLSRRAEVKIAECMLAQGFEYKVIDFGDLEQIGAAVNADSREFVEAYGFGIASNPFEESFEAFDSFVDPNQDYVMGLSEGERDAYQTALVGEPPDLDSGSFPSFAPGGCQGGAYNELFSFARVFEQFGDQFEEIEEAFNADPRIIEATSGWSSCMTEVGYRFTDVESAEADVQRRYDAILRDPDAFAEGDAPPLPTGSDDDNVVVFGPQTLNPEFQARVDDLAVEERAIALASWDCSGPLRSIADDIQIEYEQRFVDANGDAIRAALADE